MLREILFCCGALALTATVVEAEPIKYTASAYVQGISIDSVSKCTDMCMVTITAEADTADVEAFSVPGASGFKNTHLHSVKLTIVDPSNMKTIETEFLQTAGLYFSVDQTNNGAGFGSTLKTPQGVPYGPTYPLGVYCSPPSPLATFELKSSLDPLSCYSNFFPEGTAADQAPPLPTKRGKVSLQPTGVTYGSVSAVVATPQSEPPQPPQNNGHKSPRSRCEGGRSRAPECSGHGR